MSESRHIVAADFESGPLATRGGQYLAPIDRLDISGSVSFFRRRLKLILAFAAAGLAVGILLSLLMSKTYRAEATIMLTNDAAVVAQSVSNPTPQAVLSDEVVDTQVEIITSREMANRVAEAAGLMDGIGSEEKDNVIGELRRDVSARRSGKSYALTIAYDAKDPDKAAAIANEFANQFVNWDLQKEKNRNSESKTIVEQRLTELRQQAQVDTQALQQYRISNNLLSTSGASLTEQEISAYNQEVTRARAEAAEDQARLQTALAQLRSGSAGDDVGEALDSPVISSLRSQETVAAAKLADLAAKYGPNHPQLIRAKSELEEIRGRIEAEIGRVISNLKARQAVSSQRLASLNSSLVNARAKLSLNNSAMVGLSELERAAEASQGIYETYLNRFKELLAADGSEKPNAQVLTFAQAPLKPRLPNIPLNLALSLVIGLGLGLIGAYVMESLFHGISTPDEVERDLGVPFLASIPLLASVDSLHSHAVSAIQGNPKSVFTESFRTLSVSIGQASLGNGQIIAVTSALPSEGKTVISCCLSHVYALEGKRTMLIDCDLRRQGISRLLEMQSSQKGLIQVLDGTAPLNLEQYEGDNVFCVLPLAPSDEESEQSEQLLTGEAFVELLDKLRSHFDRIVLDLPPILPIASTRILASRADAVIMAAKWRSTSSLAIRSAMKRLPTNQVNLLGVALSCVDMRKRAFIDPDDPNFYYPSYSAYYS